MTYKCMIKKKKVKEREREINIHDNTKITPKIKYFKNSNKFHTKPKVLFDKQKNGRNKNECFICCL
jgi:hypothetical protein